jgi:hypothetical protein
MQEESTEMYIDEHTYTTTGKGTTKIATYRSSQPFFGLGPATVKHEASTRVDYDIHKPQRSTARSKSTRRIAARRLPKQASPS